MASVRRLVRTERPLDRIVAGLLAIGALGGLFAGYHFLGEIAQLHEALRVGNDSVENLDPGTALPTVYVLGGYAVAFAVLFAAVAVLILRASPLGSATLRAGLSAMLPGALLAYLATYIRYQEYVDAMPPGTRDPAYRSVIIGQVIGGGVSAAGVAAALLVLLGLAVARWFRPGSSAPVSAGPSGSAVNAAKFLALAGTVVGLLVPVAWVRPVGGDGELPTEWSLLALLTGVLTIAALVAAGLTLLARPGRLLFRYMALGALVVVASVEWVVTLWQSFYADVAYGSERVDGVAVAWTAAIACGLIGSGLLTAAAVALVLPTAEPDVAAAPTTGPQVTRASEPAAERAARRVGDGGPDPAWQAFPTDKPASRITRKKAPRAKRKQKRN